MAKVLELKLQHQSFQWIFKVYFLQGWLVWSPCSPRESSPAPQFESLLQHLSSKATIFQRSALFMARLLHPHTTTGETIALTIWTFVSKVMSLLFNTLSRFVIAFLSRSKSVLISWLQSPPKVILELKKIKSVTVSTFPPSICHEMMAPDAMIFIFWTLIFKPTFFTLLFCPHQEAL